MSHRDCGLNDPMLRPCYDFRIFNTGSPYNVPAGHGTGNLDKVIAHYEKKNKEEQERKMQMLRDGTLPIEQEPRPKSEWTKPKD